MSKFLNHDAAVQIAEEAFRAGFKSAQEVARDSGSLNDSHCAPNFWPIAEELAWAAFEPSEAAKDLVTDDYPSGCGHGDCEICV